MSRKSDHGSTTPPGMPIQGMRPSSSGRSGLFIPLRYRFILFISCILVLVLGVLATVLGGLQSRTLKRELEYRGRAVAKSLAATSRSDLVTYNYAALDRAANQAVDGNTLVYVILQDKEGRVAGFSNHPELQGAQLSDPLSRRSLEEADVLIQEGTSPLLGVPVLEVSQPVRVPGTDMRWGTVRIGLSLLPMAREKRVLQAIIFSIGGLALACGILLSILAAQRVTRPLNRLVRATEKAADGDLDQDVRVATGDEVEILAANFFQMIREILARRQELELKLAEISRLQQYREKVLTTMADGLISVDRGGVMVTINPAARRLLDLEEATGPFSLQDLGEHLAPLRELVLKLLEEPESAGSNEVREIVFYKGGQVHSLLIAASALADPSGLTLEVIVNLHDITAFKQLEERMRQSERLSALGTLAAGMAHEIRNPLSAINTFVQLVPRKRDKPAFMDKFQHTVPREIKRINQLVEELLELSRMPRYHFEPTDVLELVRHTVALLEPEMASTGVCCDVVCPGDTPRVWADGEQLSKAVHNIVRNAVQAMPEGGRLRIDARVVENGDLESGTGRAEAGQAKWLEVIFRDTGNGIKESDLGRIFDPFFTTKDRGTGLGLSITHKVVTEHRGQIDISGRSGKGTRVTVRLPVVTGERCS